MRKHESIKMVTFRTKESMEESMKLMDESKNRWSKNTGLKFEGKLGEKEDGRQAGRDIYRVDL
jgi:hypothetical protein